jgi:hypothetical protein
VSACSASDDENIYFDVQNENYFTKAEITLTSLFLCLCRCLCEFDVVMLMCLSVLGRTSIISPTLH